jgi:ribosomal protein L37AE/L43A
MTDSGPRADDGGVPASTPGDATCPFCHTTNRSLTQEALATGSYWRCVRCGQRWDAGRLATVAAYARWSAAHEERLRLSADAGRPPTDVPTSRDPS